MMRYLLLSVLVVSLVGVLVIPNAFAVGESIIKEKDCEAIGKELDPNIECKLVIKNWDEMSLPKEFAICINNENRKQHLLGYDSDNNQMYFGYCMLEHKMHYVVVEMDNFTIVDQVKCDGVTTGTYDQTTTYPCKLQYTPSQKGGQVIQSQTKTPYLYTFSAYTSQILPAAEKKLQVFEGDGDSADRVPIHTYNTDIHWRQEGGRFTPPEIFLNEDKNELYYFVCGHSGYNRNTNSLSYNPDGTYKDQCAIYQINGMGELKNAAAFTTTEPKSTAEPEQMIDEEPVTSSPTCGEGTVLKNGVCVVEEKSEGGGCLIATAAFGSEMAPQIQFLRELRDNTVLQTESGSVFMSGFNQFYYSFSPAIADYERENPAFKEAVKITLTPLLASLTLLQYADIDSESEMLGYGIGVILLNIGMYFVAPAVLIMAVRKRI